MLLYFFLWNNSQIGIFLIDIAGYAAEACTQYQYGGVPHNAVAYDTDTGHCKRKQKLAEQCSVESETAVERNHNRRAFLPCWVT